MIKKILLVAPANTSFMPYLDYYIRIYDKHNIRFDVISWDRLSIDDNADGYQYKDGKKKHARNLLDYFLFSRFVKSKFKAERYTRVIVFGLPTLIFTSGLLKSFNSKGYLIDIRDHHKAINLPIVKKILKQAGLVVISSARFSSWLPSIKYVVSHNTNEMQAQGFKALDGKIIISCIGALKDFDVNKQLIDKLKNLDWCELQFNGEGVINSQLEEYVKAVSAKNVVITGRYIKKQEFEIYSKATFINMLMSDTLNNNTCLSNRLYNSVIFGVPLIVYQGSYIAEIVKEYNLGLVLSRSSIGAAEFKLLLACFDFESYESGRRKFINFVNEQNLEFEERLVDFSVGQNGR
ncbi:hypothetical protein H5162_20900 [Pseudoalteromonas sp. SR41-8]|uniref:hypothetical protein n=1 Tax=Pseudoalteromonas sp. SR41-8 TaxID=2760946 RepID=UPI001603DD50|nr:hypothetical protein [Pseudoalteromonas sp. SR41-8]MBB1311869.1 hypothetical protein [Pseudoalteromonas sp. SR41-8]